jgi:hypothetical protein
MSLDGVWQVLLTVVTTTHVPVLGESRTVSSSLTLATIAGGVQTQRMCDSWMTDRNPLAEVLLPEAFIAAFPEESFPVELGESGGRVTYRVVQPRQAVGYDAAGPMPLRAEDPGVTDWEGDGRPGATVRVRVPFAGEGEVWMVQVGRTVLDGVVLGADRVEGGVRTLEFAQRTIGASNRLLDVNPIVRPDDAASRFVMTRVPDGTTCGTLPGRRER